MVRKLLAVALACLTPASAPHAQVMLEGRFTATRDCPAQVSTKHKDNPGGAMVAAGRAYELRGKNKDEASHYWIRVPGASPQERWVEVHCGKISTSSGGVEEAKPKVTNKPAASGNQPLFVLALSWQPAFCESRPKNRECRQQGNDRFDATHLSLHGLWPQPGTNIYCGVPSRTVAADSQGRWRDLPETNLSLATRKELETIMPGAQSLLDRHEWIKHGTCYAESAEAYYRDSIRLVNEINSSPVVDFLASRIGRRVTAAEIRAKFDEAFGAGAGERVRLACGDDDGRQLIVELTIGLRGDIAGGDPVSSLLSASRPTDPGCPGGIIDPVGLQ